MRQVEPILAEQPATPVPDFSTRTPIPNRHGLRPRPYIRATAPHSRVAHHRIRAMIGASTLGAVVSVGIATGVAGILFALWLSVTRLT